MITFLKRQAHALNVLYQNNHKLSLERNELLFEVEILKEQNKTLTEEITLLKTLDSNQLIEYAVNNYQCKEIKGEYKEKVSHEVEEIR